MKMNLKVIASINGKVLYEKELDPWVVGITVILHGYRYVTTALAFQDTSNTNRSHSTAAARANAGSGIDTFGPVVGTGTTDPAWGDYNLGTKIAHGTGTGQLSYGAVTFNAPVTDGNDRYFEVIRVFTNLSGASITVYEFGIICYTGSYYFLVCRDVNASGIEIPNGQALTLTYKIKITI